MRKDDTLTQKLTAEIITAAILGFEAQKTKIDTQLAELRAMLSGGSTQTGECFSLTCRSFRRGGVRNLPGQKEPSYKHAYEKWDWRL